MEADESPWATATRELIEELGWDQSPGRLRAHRMHGEQRIQMIGRQGLQSPPVEFPGRVEDGLEGLQPGGDRVAGHWACPCTRAG
ncbi:MAG: hypothetical protein ACRDTA_01230 [Pseudonocardiaceae bacterium]